MKANEDYFGYLRDKKGRYYTSKYWSSIIYLSDDVNIDFIKSYFNSVTDYIISPVHDKDKFIDDGSTPIDKVGTIKKAHIHIIFCSCVALSPTHLFKFCVSPDNPKAICVGLERVVDINHLLHYLTHTGYNYELTGKAEYSVDDYIYSSPSVESMASSYLRLSADELNIFAIVEFIDNNNISSFRQLINFLRDTGNMRYLLIVYKNCNFFRFYIKDC